MNATELMIGDHVFFLGHVHQIRAIEHKPEDNFSTIMFYGKNKVITTTKEVEPIPLTVEILEKNGFQYDAIGAYFLDEVQFVIYCLNNRFHIDSCCASIEFKYIHELQHALRLCGLSELADNFKV